MKTPLSWLEPVARLLDFAVCPECMSSGLEYNPGHPGSLEEPPEAPSLYCPICGWLDEPSDEIEALLREDPC